LHGVHLISLPRIGARAADGLTDRKELDTVERHRHVKVDFVILIGSNPCHPASFMIGAARI